MDWIFRKLFGETLASDEMIQWLFATYEWLLRYRGGYAEFKRTRKLVLPLNEVFLLTTNDGSRIAGELFEQGHGCGPSVPISHASGDTGPHTRG